MDNHPEKSNNQEADQDIENQVDDGHNYCTKEQCKATNKTNKTNNYCSGNFCLVCGINMGDGNPRQLCRKTYCPDEE